MDKEICNGIPTNCFGVDYRMRNLLLLGSRCRRIFIFCGSLFVVVVVVFRVFILPNNFMEL